LILIAISIPIWTEGRNEGLLNSDPFRINCSAIPEDLKLWTAFSFICDTFNVNSISFLPFNLITETYCMLEKGMLSMLRLNIEKESTHHCEDEPVDQYVHSDTQGRGSEPKIFKLKMDIVNVFKHR
jgi:hypothetical protein